MKTKQITVREIIADWLKTNGYDGLVGGSGCVGCRGKDLLSCVEEASNCVAGHKIECDDSWCGGECGYHIKAGKNIQIK